MILPATEFKTKMGLKRSMVVIANGSRNPKLVKAQYLQLRTTIENELLNALNNFDSAPASIKMQVSEETWEGVEPVVAYFTALGYALNWRDGVLTISW